MFSLNSISKKGKLNLQIEIEIRYWKNTATIQICGIVTDASYVCKKAYGFRHLEEEDCKKQTKTMYTLTVLTVCSQRFFLNFY